MLRPLVLDLRCRDREWRNPLETSKRLLVSMRLEGQELWGVRWIESWRLSWLGQLILLVWVWKVCDVCCWETDWWSTVVRCLVSRRFVCCDECLMKSKLAIRKNNLHFVFAGWWTVFVARRLKAGDVSSQIVVDNVNADARKVAVDVDVREHCWRLSCSPCIAWKCWRIKCQWTQQQRRSTEIRDWFEAALLFTWSHSTQVSAISIDEGRHVVFYSCADSSRFSRLIISLIIFEYQSPTISPSSSQNDNQQV